MAFFMLSTSVMAQNFQMLKSNCEYLFRRNVFTQTRSIHVESISYDGDSIFYMNPHIRVLQNQYDCFTPEGASMIGYEVRISNDGTHVFHNYSNEPIIIKAQEAIGASWICWTITSGEMQISASVESIAPEEFLGLTDMVKTIRFQMLNAAGQPVNHYTNELRLKISENYGMVCAINFYAFPIYMPSQPLYFDSQAYEHNIWGMSAPQLGVQNLTAREIFDYEIDDEIHYIEYSRFQGTGWEIHFNERVIDKVEYQDSTVYTIDRKRTRYEVNVLDLIFDWEQIDEYTLVAKADPLIDPLPDVPINGPGIVDWGIYYLNTQELVNGRREKQLIVNSIGFLFNEDTSSCMSQIIDYFCFSGVDTRYIEGVGGPFHSCNNAFNYTGIQLRYFQKQDETWGVPLSVPILDPFASNQVKIYPNPIKDAFSVETAAINLPVQIEIYDLTGRTIFQEMIFEEQSLHKIDIPNKGLLFYNIRNNKGVLQKGKLVAAG
jgi:hypothetical protein